MNWLKKHWLFIYTTVVAIIYAAFAMKSAETGGNSEMIEGNSLVVVIIGVIGVSLAAAIGGWFSNRGATIKDVKADTASLKPVIEMTLEKTSEANKYIINDLRPDLKKSNEVTNKIDKELLFVLDDIKFRKRLAENNTGVGYEMMAANMQAVFAELNDYKEKCKEYQAVIEKQKGRIAELQVEVGDLHKEIEEIHDRTNEADFEL